MVFDDNLVLRDGSVDLDENEVAAISATANADGAKVIDLKGSGEKGLVAVLVLPTAATTYADTLTVAIQDSEHLTDGWETIADFRTFYALMRVLEVTSTTAFVATDIGLILTATTDAASDGGVIRYLHPNLLTLSGKGNIVISMSDANDDYSTAADTVTATAGTGIGTQGTASVAYPPGGILGVHKIRFVTRKRYIRGLYTVSAGGNFLKASLFITNAYEDTIMQG